MNLNCLDSRYFEPYDSSSPSATNMEKAMDVVDVNGRLGSVLVSEKQLLFIVWHNRFPVKKHVERLMKSIEWTEERLVELSEEKKEVTEKLEKDPMNEKLRGWMERVKQSTVKMQEKLLRAREQLRICRDVYE